MIAVAISMPSSNLGHVGILSRWPGQIYGNSCLHSRGNICSPILMKVDQNVCLDNI